MKASYLFVLFILTALCSSCTDYLNKPLAEPMSVEDLKGAIKQDTAFLDFYETVQKFRKDFFAEDLNQVKYGDLTYRRLYDYVNKLNDTLFTKPLYDKAQNEWDSKYAVYASKVDSVAAYWKKYEEENSLSSYVSICFIYIVQPFTQGVAIGLGRPLPPLGALLGGGILTTGCGRCRLM